MFKNLRIFGLLILYALNPIFFIYTQNLSEVSLTDCINISVIFILVSSVFFLLLTIFLKISKLKALIISIIFIIIFNISEPVWNGYLYNYEDTFLSDYFELSLL
ncbi:MAG TPA: hypothetical protein PLQ81_03580, partial [bacterium]|nr:hypothetical protein [bacterium]